MHHPTHTAGITRLGIGRLPSARRRIAHRSPIARIVGHIIRPGRHGRWCYGRTTGSGHTRGLALGKRAGERGGRQRRGRGGVTRTQSDAQSLKLMTTQCCSQRRRLYCMFTTAGRRVVAGGRPAAARMLNVPDVVVAAVRR